MQYKVKLKIAGVIIEMRSKFIIQKPSKEEKKRQYSQRFNNFFYAGREKPDILIRVGIVEKLPQVCNARPLFITYHFQDGSENWRLLKKGSRYIYRSPLKDREQLMLVNKAFNRVNAYLLPKGQNSALDEEGREFIKKNKGLVWYPTDIIYDFLQVLLINYFALNKQGIFTHAVGVKDLDERGLLFAGRSGCGKSTSARLWHKHSRAMVLNDDRIIIRKLKDKFFIYGSPWHGEFSDYLSSRIEAAPLEKLFFIYHAPSNSVRRIFQKEAFQRLYPALFPAFWDKECLENTASFCEDLLCNTACYSLGFVNNKQVIDFVRKI